MAEHPDSEGPSRNLAPRLFRWWWFSTAGETVLIAIPIIGWLPALVLIPMVGYRGGKALATVWWPLAKAATYIGLLIAWWVVFVLILGSIDDGDDTDPYALLFFASVGSIYAIMLVAGLVLVLISGFIGVGVGRARRASSDEEAPW